MANGADEKNPQNDQTSKVEAPKANVGKSKTSYSSIITEDDSDEDDVPIPIKVYKNPRNHKELFK